jgi:hypothetical protein
MIDFAITNDDNTIETQMDLFIKMDWVIGKLVNMARHPEKSTLL